MNDGQGKRKTVKVNRKRKFNNCFCFPWVDFTPSVRSLFEIELHNNFQSLSAVQESNTDLDYWKAL